MLQIFQHLIFAVATADIRIVSSGYTHTIGKAFAWLNHNRGASCDCFAFLWFELVCFGLFDQLLAVVGTLFTVSLSSPGHILCNFSCLTYNVSCEIFHSILIDHPTVFISRN